MGERKIRVLLAKPGLDGHDRGAKVVAHAMREAICRKLMGIVKEQDIGNKLVVVGGVIPNKDVSTLKDIGVSGIFPGGVHFDEIVKFIRENAVR